jgi:ESCRT-II complex subunit VPS22
MRRRALGISGLERQAKAKEYYKEMGEVIQINLMVQMKEQLQIFKTNLEEFAMKHHKDIKQHPEFRAYFQRMCSRIGIDPLLCKHH